LGIEMASRVGQTLRKARTERGVELSEVERATKIRVKFLEAMEEDRWEELPAPVYARGFLDIYARYLGLDPQALLDQYREAVEGERREPIPKSVIKPGVLRQTRPGGPTRSIKWGPVGKVVAGLLAIVIVGLVIVGSIGGSDNGGDNEKPKKAKGTKAAGPATPATTTTTSTTPAGEVSVELRATDTVWVCLVDDTGTPVVDSETLSANEARGPFSGSRFEATFGNGSVEMTVDGEPAPVPAVAEPIGYRITPSGVRRLDPSAQPTCI
jgi:cytoskeletal protein RodZ